MKVLFIGDIMGKAGRKVVCENVPKLRRDLSLDFVVANGENAAGGFGMTPKIVDEFLDAQIDCLTSGNHIWGQKEILTIMDDEPRLLRPINYPEKAPGHGIYWTRTARDKTVVVINVMGRIFMDPLDDPFRMVDEALNKYKLGKTAHFILVDIHAEATSEKMAMGHFSDGRASLVVGTHSHIPTADAQILPKGCAYQTDAGMCGDYNSVIGMEADEPLRRFVTKVGGKRFSPATGEPTFCGVFVESDDETGHAKRIVPVRLGARLHPSMPS